MSIRQRLNGIVKIPQDYRRPDPPCPKSVKIELTPRCNYHCQYCGYSFRKDKREDMDFGFFKEIAKEMMREGVEEFGLFYIGEPFINTELLVDCLYYLKKELKVPYTFITSNGSLAFPNKVRKVMEAGLDSLKWSCNAADAQQAKTLLGVPEWTFDTVKDNIKEAHKTRYINGYKTKLYASSIKYDEEQLWKMEPFLAEMLPYFDEHYWLPLFTMGGVANEREKELGYQPVAGNPGRCDEPVDPIPCWTLFTAAHVLSDGRLTACCMDATGKWAMGDLKTQSFMDCWLSDEFKSLRAEHLRNNVIGTKCEKCVLAG